jgi:hypothetical protein
MTELAPFTLLRSPAWPSLARRLDEAVAASPALGPAREALLRPIQLLELLALDALAALRDDFFAAERVRAVLCIAEPWQDLGDQVGRILKAQPAPSPAPYEPGVLHHGRLTLLALAAIRVTPNATAAFDKVRAVVGLALAASPVEVLGRMDPRPPSVAELSVILQSLAARGAIGRAGPAVLRSFANDPVERGRWRCVIDALNREALGADLKGPWDGAYADPIEAVSTVAGWPGELELIGKFAIEKPLLEKQKLTVVCSAPDRAPLPALAKVVGANIRINAPEAAEAGWLGFTSDKRILDSNTFRKQVRARWNDRALATASDTFRQYLRDGVVPTELIPLLGPKLSSPPRTATNRYFGGLPLLLEATLVPDSANPEQLRLSWSSVGATQVSLVPGVTLAAGDQLAPAGAQLIPAPTDVDVSYTLTPIAERTDPATGATTTLVGATTTLSAAAPARDDSQDVSGGRALRAVVLVRPVVLRDGDPVSVPADAAREALLTAAKRMNVALANESIRELPWLDDSLAVLASDVRSAEDPRIPLLLEELSGVATRTVGFEDALWLLLVPDERDTAPESGGEGGGPIEIESSGASPSSLLRSQNLLPGVEKHLPAEAALAVAVSDRRGLAPLFQRLFPSNASAPSTRPATPRLRLIGTIQRDGEVLLEPPREEVRHAGPGAEIDSGVLAVTLDGDGRELQRVPIKTLREFTPARFALLLPVSPEVQAVELRLGDELLELRVDAQVLDRLLRIPGPPTLTLAAGSAEGELSWTYSHPVSALPSFEVELVDGQLSTPLLSVDACARSIKLPLHHFGNDRKLHVRLVASDGWNADAKTLDVDFSGDGALIARRVSSSLWWAETDLDDGPLSWALDGKEVGGGRLLAIDPRTRPRDLTAPGKTIRTLTLSEVVEGDLGLSDARSLGEPDA